MAKVPKKGIKIQRREGQMPLKMWLSAKKGCKKAQKLG